MFLVLMLGVNAVGAIEYSIGMDVMRRHFQRASEAQLTMIGIASWVNLALVALIWRWRRLGVYGAVAVGVAVAAMNVYLGYAAPYVIFGLSGPIILICLLRSRWGQFS